MGKKFMGLDGTNHFWDRAKAWILEQITSAGIDKQSVIDAVYPVGSLYWSSKDTDPSTLFGGTWVQIKDKFVLACGDTYKTVGATGGASSVTLSVSNMPSHSHSFTPSGSISITTNPTFTGSAVNSGGSGEHTHIIATTTSNPGSGSSSNYLNFSFTNSIGNQNSVANSGFNTGTYYKLPTRNNPNLLGCTIGADIDRRQSNFYTNGVVATLSGYHTHNVTASGKISGGTYNFTGSKGTTESNGSGTSFSILPPYVVKYCWERTA